MKINLIYTLIAILLVFPASRTGAQGHIIDLGLQVQHADIAVGDINGNGLPDVLITGEGGSAVLLNNGDSTFAVAGESTLTTYSNPVFEPDLADPTIIRAEDGWFYAYGTENTWPGGHRVTPIVKSRDLVNWEYVGQAFAVKPDWKPGYIWAPSIHRLNGLYYLYYSNSTWGDENPGIGLALAENPEGPFTDRGMLLDTRSTGVINSIDPYLFSEGGENHLFWGSLGGGIYGIRLSSDGMRITGEKFQVAGNSFEGVYIHKREGFYYIFLSTGSCCDGASSTYRVVAGRSQNLEGPYLTKNGSDLMNYNDMWWAPMVDNIDGVIIKSNDHVAGPGHNAQIVADDRGDDWFIYHGIVKSNPLLPNGATRRPLFIERIAWKNGWPEINRGTGPGVQEQQAPFFKQ